MKFNKRSLERGVSRLESGLQGTIVVAEAGRGNRMVEFPPSLRGLLRGSLHGHTARVLEAH